MLNLIVEVTAGDSIGFIADQGVSHPGPVFMYMAKVPAGQDISTWDGSGNVWFKAGYYGPTVDSKGLNWSTYCTYSLLSLTLFMKYLANIPLQ